MTIADKVKENPIIATLLAISILATTVTGGIKGIQSIDQLVMTEIEHAADLAPLKDEVNGIHNWQRCDRLERRVILLEDRLWAIRNGALLHREESAAREIMRQVEADLRVAQRNFTALNCGKILAK